MKIGKSHSGKFYNLYHRKRSEDNKERNEQNEIVALEVALLEPTGRFKIAILN